MIVFVYLTTYRLWCKGNALDLNVKKYNTMTFTLKSDIFDYQLDGVSLSRLVTIAELIQIDSKLSFTTHVNMITNRMFCGFTSVSTLKFFLLLLCQI